MKKFNLYLIRHGQTQWNIEEKMQGSKNSPLTEVGIDGAKKVGQFLKNTKFIAAYSSPLTRAVETRDYILAQRNDKVPAYTLDSLQEMDFGDWEGEHVPTKLKFIPEFQLFLNDPANFDATKNKGENYYQVLNRMQKSLDSIIENFINNVAINNTNEENNNILIVSHGTALRVLLCALNGGELAKHRDDAYFSRILNTSISKVSFNSNDTPKYHVHFINKII